MARITRRQFAATAAAAAAGTKLGLTTALAQENYPTRPIQVICPWGAGGGTDATARIVAALLERDFGPTRQRRQPHRRLGGGRSLGDRDLRARRLHARHHHGRDRDDALAGADRAHAAELHPARPDEPGSARHPGQVGRTLQDGEGACRRHQGGAVRQVQGVGHRPGGHLASGVDRLAHGDGTEARSRAMGAFQRRGARHAGSGCGWHRHRDLLDPGGAGHD